MGVALFPARRCADDVRLEEMVYRTSRAALDDAGITRRQLDHVTLGGCDELDGRPISSMLLAAPAGAYLTDETKVTDSGATALCLAFARMLTGECHLGLVASWCKTSKVDVEAVMHLRGDPFFVRPLGLGLSASDALFAQAVCEEFGVTDAEAAARAVRSFERAAENPRGVKNEVPTPESVLASEMEATPVRKLHRAPFSDGAVSMVLASDSFLRRNPDRVPLARIAGVGWATDSYRLGTERLRSMRSARKAWTEALGRAGLESAAHLDVVELDSQTSYHEAAYVRVFGLDDEDAVSPSGGPFAQNPLFATGLVAAAEGVLQVAGRAGPAQRPAVRHVAAHGCHGFAQQGNVVTIFEHPEFRR